VSKRAREGAGETLHNKNELKVGNCNLKKKYDIKGPVGWIYITRMCTNKEKNKTACYHLSVNINERIG
jgi:hypothetical protein